MGPPTSCATPFLLQERSLPWYVKRRAAHDSWAHSAIQKNVRPMFGRIMQCAVAVLGTTYRIGKYFPVTWDEAEK
jgi:hypothetical protein